MSEKSLKIVHFQDFSFDLEANELSHRGVPVSLRPKAKRLLGCLIAADGRTVTHEELYRQLWRREVVQHQDGLHALIRDIRVALGGGEESKRFLRNVSGVGYRFCPEAVPATMLTATATATAIAIAAPASASATAPAADGAGRFMGSRAFLTGFLAFPVAFIVFCVLAAQSG